MVFKTTFTKSLQRRDRAGFLLAETVVGVLVTSLVLLTLFVFTMFSMRSFTTMYNYVDLDDANRIAMDQITRDVRQCNKVTACNATQLILEDSDGLPLEYSYDAGLRVVNRIKNHGPPKTMLKECDRVNFEIGQRNVMNQKYDVYPAATPDTAKVINVSWLCSRTIFGRKENTESVQTARIVIRKQGT
jgi:hypothetical protein